jgi:hypothetical protein
VQIALDAAALVIRCCQDVCPRLAQLGQRALHAGGQAAIVIPDERVRPHGLDERALLAQGCVMDDRRHRGVAVEDQRGAPAGGWGREGHRFTVDVDPAVALRPPKGQFDHRVAEGGRDQVAPLSSSLQAGKPARQTDEAVRDVDTPSEQADQEADAQRRQSEGNDRGGRDDDRVISPAPTQAECDGERERPEYRDDEDGDQGPAHERGGSANTIREPNHDGEEDRSSEQFPQRHDDVVQEGRLRRQHHERVAGALLELDRAARNQAPPASTSSRPKRAFVPSLQAYRPTAIGVATMNAWRSASATS